MTPSTQVDRFLSRLRSLLPPGTLRVERFLSEAEDHLAETIGRLEAAGCTRSEAEREAFARFGTPEEVAATFPAGRHSRPMRSAFSMEPIPGGGRRGDGMMQTLRQNLRFGWRSLRRTPGFTLVAVCTLALGIGANTAIFSIVNSILLRPLPFPEPDRLVWVWGTRPQISQATFSDLDFLDHAATNTSFEHLGAFTRRSMIWTKDGSPERLHATRVSKGFFSALAMSPVVGRTFLPEEHHDGTNHVVVLSESLWRSAFGADRDVVGKSLLLDGNTYGVVGVQLDAGRLYSQTQIWIPLSFDGSQQTNRSNSYLFAVGRLKPGVTRAQAEAELKGIAATIDHLHPKPGYSVRLESLHDRLTERVRASLVILMGAVGFILLIACANIANLMLVRAQGREKEMAIRAALGAGWRRLGSQLLTESLMLAALGGLVGVAVAYEGVRLLQALDPGYLPPQIPIQVDLSLMVFVLFAVLFSGTISGLSPLLLLSRLNLGAALREGGRRSSGGDSSKLRNALVVAEIALSLVLLIGAGLLLRSTQELQKVEPGFDTENVVVAQIMLRGEKWNTLATQNDFYVRLLEGVEALPGVEAAALIDNLPFSGSSSNFGLWVAGHPDWDPDRFPVVENAVTSPDYFRTMGINLLRGRLYSLEETEQQAPVVLVSESLAEKFFPGQDPIGQRVTQMGAEGPWWEIIGVVGDVRQFDLSWSPRPTIYYAGLAGWSLVVRGRGNSVGLPTQLRDEIHRLDSSVPVLATDRLGDWIASSLGGRQFNMLLLASFAGTAFLLAVIGLYGVISYTVSRRVHEIGVRMALGADPSSILRLVLGRGLVLILAGVGLGLAGAFLLAGTMESLLFGVSGTDPQTFLLVSLLLSGTALAALLGPALRATRVDPMVALRYE